MINVYEYDGEFPVSVIVPLSEKRKNFFNQFTLPSIEGMGVKEIIINDNFGGACKKRNDGAKKATQPFILFSDDDLIFPVDFIKKGLETLEKNPNKGYAYSGYDGIVMDYRTHPLKQNFTIPSIPFNGPQLKKGNYISTMSLLKKEYFFGFDENLKRFHDWDLWLTLLSKGIEGICVPEMKFLAFYLDEGITSNTNNEMNALLAIKNKHNI